jgi:4-hydroxybenzoate polyprenyltransferase
VLDWLRLLRISGLATIVSNSLTAVAFAFFAGEGQDLRWFLARIWHNGPSCLWVPLTSLLLFAAGMLWNDLVDVDRDRRGNPDRPLAAGRIGLVPAYVAGVLVVIGAVLAALMIDRTHYYGLMMAGVVLVLSLLYNLVAKVIPWLGSLVMGLTRAAHACFAVLVIGADHLQAALSGAVPGLRSFWVYPTALLLWTTGVTLISELEDADRRGTRLEFLAGGALLLAALGLALGQLAEAPWLQARGLGLIGGVAVVAVALWCVWRVGRPWWQALVHASCADAGKAVAAGLGGLILLDVVLAASSHPLLGLAALACLPLFNGLSRFVRMD